MPIQPTGPEDAKLYVVGEAPGGTEDARGIPLCGAPGNLLWSALFNDGIRRSKTRVNTVIHSKLPGGKWEKADPELLAKGRAALVSDIRRVQPNLVFVLGEGAFQILTGKKGVGNWRGSLLWSKELGCKILPAVAPKDILRNYSALPLFYFDCAKAARHKEIKTLVQVRYKLKLFPTYTDVLEWNETLCRPGVKMAFDIETFPDPNLRLSRMRCLAFASSERDAICIPTLKSYWGEQLGSVMQLVKETLQYKHSLKCAQNGQFDCGVLKEAHGIEVQNMVFDTMCAQHVAYSELPKALAVLISIYTDEAYHKGMGHPPSGDWTPTEDYYRYNALDAARTFQVWPVLEKELEELGMLSYYQKYTHPLIEVMLELQHNGVPIDEKTFMAIRLGEEMRYNKAQLRLTQLIGAELNPKSPKQMQSLLYGLMALPVQKEKGSITTNEKALRKLQSKVKSEHAELFSHILTIRNASKNIGTYLNSRLVRKGKMHTSYNIGGSIKDSSTGRITSAPSTGRLSSSRSIVFDSGTNMQNFPRPYDIASTRVSESGEVTFTYKSNAVRSCVVPSPGRILLEADLSQAEARVIAYISGCAKLIKMYQEGKDVHRLNACWIFNVPYEEVTKLQRQFAKTHVHAFNYDEGERQFAARAGAPISWSKRIRGKYFQEFPEIKGYHAKVKDQLFRTRILTTRFGRKRTFFGRMNEETFRSGYAYDPQGTIGELLNLILTLTFKTFKKEKLRSKLILQVHDSIGIDTHPKELDHVCSILKKHSDVTLRTDDGVRFKIPIEFKTGKNWAEMKDYNPWEPKA